MKPGFPHSRLLARLDRIVAFNDADRDGISALPMTLRNFPAEHEIVAQGARLNKCCMVVDGFLYRHKPGDGAQRQIVSFHVPGDIPDLYSLHINPMDHHISTLGPAVVAFIPHHPFREMLARSPRLTDIFWRETLVDASLFREWVVNIGTRDALARIAHLLCEMEMRLEVVGLAPNLTFSFPASQTHIADACGISAIHANRMIQELRSRRLIEWEGKTIRILDRDRLAEIADFDPAYLHLRDRAVVS